MIDGGNSFYKDSMKRAQGLKEKGISFLDVGTSGGIWGPKVGYCLMIGGEEDVFRQVEPIFETLAPKDGYAYVGTGGAGHFVKMVHNGIEYALLQGYAEGFEIMHAKKAFNLHLSKIAYLWNQGSVIRSWLLELAENAFNKDPNLDSVRDYVEDSGEGRWTIGVAKKLNVPVEIIKKSLEFRVKSRKDPKVASAFAARLVAALRNVFGGHEVKKKS